MKAVLNELPVLQGYKAPTADEVYKMHLHNQYIKQNYHPITMAKLEGWMCEEEWLLNQNI